MPGWFYFGGLPTFFLVLFLAAFLIVAGMFLWSVVLFVRGLRWDLRFRDADSDPDAFDWIFLVPALNEEVTIADSVNRLEGVEVARKRIVVIDDGSDDRTGEILAGMDSPDLTVLKRKTPAARQGKAAALNFAFAEVATRFDPDPAKTIFCVVDADGRISPESPSLVAVHFEDPQVGGVQSLVRIYNRHRFLTWFQDIEFSIYGRLFQAGRSGWGTAGMGGNGQYNRMAALLAIDDRANEPDSPGKGNTGSGESEPQAELTPAQAGPWRDRLTEDQDLGLRLVVAGWKCCHDNRARVDQQGLPGLRRLFRQRTRWSQGNLQAIGLAGSLARSDLVLPVRVEQIVFLLMPFWQLVIGTSLIASIYLALTGTAYFSFADNLLWLYFLYLLGFGGTLLGCIAARIHDGNPVLGVIKGVLTGQIYAFYSWLLWPVLIRSFFRQMTSRQTWAKTAREQIEPEPAATEPV